MPNEKNARSPYRARAGREVFDVALEWRVEDREGILICTAYDGVIAAKIAAALNLAELAAAGADVATLVEALEPFRHAGQSRLPAG